MLIMIIVKTRQNYFYYNLFKDYLPVIECGLLITTLYEKNNQNLPTCVKMM